MKNWLIQHKIHVVVVLLLGFGGFYYFYLQVPMDSAPLNSISQVNEALKQDVETGTEKNATPAANQPENIMVDVKGQVNRPGVYQSNTGERVIDVIGRAGGLTEQADQTQVNFAEHVEDEMVIYIPGKGEEGSSLPSSIGTSGTVSSADGQKQGKININKADEQELQNLPGIGPAKAAAIIEFRNTSGPFKAIEDLKNISGIGDKTFEKLKDLIAVK
ncbi:MULTISPECIES: helix-hairpin-helix domain-containing protein [unclassified Bacillus (in: firmicutes)]|uniref:helix-hairpin-helix domain-containing protein n=1 Tax=unclassified Bacillus (in: firmicutes) TaxID=185979 RepID=UPI0020D277C0|nr:MULTISPECIES: helix-hairpin-helix domain-containing protein [unclassified Bacillus (in: firmicutes)]